MNDTNAECKQSHNTIIPNLDQSFGTLPPCCSFSGRTNSPNSPQSSSEAKSTIYLHQIKPSWCTRPECSPTGTEYIAAIKRNEIRPGPREYNQFYQQYSAIPNVERQKYSCYECSQKLTLPTLFARRQPFYPRKLAYNKVDFGSNWCANCCSNYTARNDSVIKQIIKRIFKKIEC